jgi:hypothetical protein
VVGFAADLGFAWASRRSGFRMGFAAVWVSRGLRGGLGFAWASRRIWVSRWASRRSQVDSVSALFLSRPDPVSALSLPPPIQSQLERRRRCRPRSGLSWRCWGVFPVVLGCDSGGAGVCFTCVFLPFTLHQTL